MKSSRWATAAGLATIAIWSSWYALSRHVMEFWGPPASGAATNLVAGIIGTLWLVRSGRSRGVLAHLPKKYLWGCGAVFMAYTFFITYAIALAADHRQVLVVMLIHYLWPPATLVLSIPLLKARPRPAFALGLVLTLAGLAFLFVGRSGLDWHAFADSLRQGLLPYCLALAAALSWALYSNLTRLWGGASAGGAAPLFLLATGIAMACAAAATGSFTSAVMPNVTWQSC